MSDESAWPPYCAPSAHGGRARPRRNGRTRPTIRRRSCPRSQKSPDRSRGLWSCLPPSEWWGVEQRQLDANQSNRGCSSKALHLAYCRHGPAHAVWRVASLCRMCTAVPPRRRGGSNGSDPSYGRSRHSLLLPLWAICCCASPKRRCRDPPRADHRWRGQPPPSTTASGANRIRRHRYYFCRCCRRLSYPHLKVRIGFRPCDSALARLLLSTSPSLAPPRCHPDPAVSDSQVRHHLLRPFSGRLRVSYWPVRPHPIGFPRPNLPKMLAYARHTSTPHHIHRITYSPHRPSPDAPGTGLALDG